MQALIPDGRLRFIRQGVCFCDVGLLSWSQRGGFCWHELIVTTATAGARDQCERSPGPPMRNSPVANCCVSD
eukprot:1319273-Amphidinium_carterae.1